MPDRPNVVIFFTDQQRWDCSGLHGNPLELMPNFDRVARRATHIHNCFTCQPVCGPARSCLQTGQYATNTGVWRNGIALKDDAATLAKLFNDAGYHTGYIGKWHLAAVKRGKAEGGIVPAGRRGGYQEWLGVEALEFSVDEYHTTLYDNDDRAVKLLGYRTDAVADAGIRFIDRHQDKPFFLMMSFIEPHHQNDRDDYPPPDGYRNRYTGQWTPPDLAALPAFSTTQEASDRPDYRQSGGTTHAHLGGYYGMVKRLDEAFGRVLDALKSSGLDKNTIVLFTSDHGCHFKTRNNEYKRSCHEASIRVPGLLAGPGFEGGGQVGELVSLVDLPPTLLDACGLAVPDTMEGRSILPLLRGAKAEWPEEVFVQISEDGVGRAVRTHRWKYCVMAPVEARNNIGGAHTYVETYLYDLESDPYEIQNLIHFESHQNVRDVLRQRLLRRMEQAGESIPEVRLAESRPSGQRRVREEDALL
jgi:arylsulfatase A-like enzyme